MRTFIDLFCGGGLGARGAFNAGFRPLVAIDLWEIACATYRENFPDATVINKPIELVSPRDHAPHAGLDLLLASPECTNHSVAKGSADRDELSKETALHASRWVGELRPKWFVIENVKEMRSWSRYSELLAELSGYGYDVSAQILNAADFGAPQARVRLFLIGTLGGITPIITPPKKIKRKTIRDILDPHGTWPETPLFSPNRAESTTSKARNAIKTLGANAEFLVVYYGSGGERAWQTLDQPLRTITTIDRFALVRKCRGKYVMRMLQPSELARAMSLDDTHKFPVGTRREQVKLCGNGVCATVVEHILNELTASEASRISGIEGRTHDAALIQGHSDPWSHTPTLPTPAIP